MRAIWNGVVLAESENTVVVEGNHYFPPQSVKSEYFSASPSTYACPWKGQANYFTVVAGGAANPDAAWSFPQPSDAAAQIAGHVAFWRGVEVRP